MEGCKGRIRDLFYPHGYSLGDFEYPEVLNLRVTRYLTAGRIRFLLQCHTTLKARLICNHFLYFKELLPVLLRFDAHDTCMRVVNMQNSHCHRKTLTVRLSRVHGDAKYTEWPKKMYTLFTHQYLWNKFK